jgi:toxin ParE1/3/4
MAHRLAPAAAADLEQIWSYIVEQSGDVEIARRFVATITDRFYLLSSNPQMGRPRDQFGLRMRSHPVGNYLIFYRIAGTDVRILRVLHGRRDLGAALGGR